LRRWFLGELVRQDAVERAQAVLANWRQVHGFARNSAAMGLRQRAAARGIGASVASRTKARASIYVKPRTVPISNWMHCGTSPVAAPSWRASMTCELCKRPIPGIA
jgi:hypothetical protein